MDQSSSLLDALAVATFPKHKLWSCEQSTKMAFSPSCPSTPFCTTPGDLVQMKQMFSRCSSSKHLVLKALRFIIVNWRLIMFVQKLLVRGSQFQTSQKLCIQKFGPNIAAIKKNNNKNSKRTYQKDTMYSLNLFLWTGFCGQADEFTRPARPPLVLRCYTGSLFPSETQSAKALSTHTHRESRKPWHTG